MVSINSGNTLLPIFNVKSYAKKLEKNHSFNFFSFSKTKMDIFFFKFTCFSAYT